MTHSEQLIQQLADSGICIDSLLDDIKSYLPNVNEVKIRKAFIYAAEAHNGQFRKENKPYIYHPVETSKVLAKLHADEDTIVAGILHDVPEDTAKTIEDIELGFGKKVSFLVEGVTKLSKVHYQNNMAQRQVDSLKKLFIHSAKDPRIILIKLADRLHNMRTLQFIDKPDKRLRIAKETLEIFVPITSLLGIEEVKIELEDLCFKYIYPDEYATISDRMKRAKNKHMDSTNEAIAQLEAIFNKNGVNATIYQRHKNLYSIFKKVNSGKRRIEDFDELITLRVLVQEVSQCYQALGLIHNNFRPKPGKFKDYIASPKINGYQSLHTVTFGSDGLVYEFQIRTNKMHMEAEYGIAANYFDSSENSHSIEKDKRAEWANKILRLKDDDDSPTGFMSGLKNDVFEDRIFVFTPKGQSVDLPKGATCIDLAYAIHTQVGNLALKADINGEISPMSTLMHNGDTVRIITSEYVKGPELSWLNFAKTNSAKNKIKEYLKKVSRAEKIRTGRLLLQKELDRAGMGFVKDIAPKITNKFCSKHQITGGMDEILSHIGEGAFKALSVMIEMFPNNTKINDRRFKLRPDNKSKEGPAIVDIKIVGKDSVGQLDKILDVLYALKINALSTKAKLGANGYFICNQTIVVTNFSQLSNLFEYLEQIPGVIKVSRVFWHRKMYFATICFITFLTWCLHPYLLNYIISTPSLDSNPIVLTTTLYIGVLLLLFVANSLKNLTEKSFPELRETATYWVSAYSVSFFALAILFAEIYYYRLTFNWIFVFALILCVIAFLTLQYINYRKQGDKQ